MITCSSPAGQINFSIRVCQCPSGRVRMIDPAVPPVIRPCKVIQRSKSRRRAGGGLPVRVVCLIACPDEVRLTALEDYHAAVKSSEYP